MRSFVKIKPSRNGKITLSFIDIGKSCLSRARIFHVTNMSFNAIRENKILVEISESTVLWAKMLSIMYLQTFDQSILHTPVSRAHPAISHCSHLLLKMKSGYNTKSMAKSTLITYRILCFVVCYFMSILVLQSS